MDPTIVDTNQTKIHICKNLKYFSSTLTENYKLIGITLYQDGQGNSLKVTLEAALLTESINDSPTSGRCDYYDTIATYNMQLKWLSVDDHAFSNYDASLGYFFLRHFVDNT